MPKPNTIRQILFSFLFFIGVFLFYPPSTILAADNPVEVRAQLPSSETKTYSSLSEYVQDFYIFSIWLITGISIIMIVYGGYTMIISSGNPEMINKGKNTIISALVSLALLVLAYTVLRIISPQIITNPKPAATTTTNSAGLSGTFGAGALPPVETPPTTPTVTGP